MGSPSGGGDEFDEFVDVTEPAQGSRHIRDKGVNEAGELIALVRLSAVASDGVASVRYETETGAVLGEGTRPSFAVDADLVAEGMRTLTAVALDGAGRAVASSSVTIEVVAPTPADCFEWLDIYGLDYTRGPDREGIEQPVTVRTPVSGIAFRAASREDQRRSMLMDCSLAVALLQAAPSLHARDIVEVADFGIYNYRCIGNEGTPPECPRGISQHAFANAIDIAGYTDIAGIFYSVNDDWVIDPEGEPTCEAATEPGKDTFLHQLICEQKLAGVWNIALTPNYNAAHRNHFHVDLKQGSDFIELSEGKWQPPAVPDEGGPAH